MERSEVIQIVRSRGWLARQPADFQAAVLDRVSQVTFATGDYVFHTGDDTGGIYGVLHGSFGAYAPSRESELQLGHVFRAGDWFGSSSAITQRSRTLTFRALEPSLAIFLRLMLFNELGGRSQAYRHCVAAMSECGTDMALMTISDLLLRRSDQRVAATLLRATAVTEGVRPSHPEGFRLTQTDLAEMSNVSRDVMNRTLAIFKARGWVATSYNHIAILDAEALADFAAGAGSMRRRNFGRTTKNADKP